jgi:hypothetical protein
VSVAASTAERAEEPCTKVTASLPPPLGSREMPLVLLISAEISKRWW